MESKLGWILTGTVKCQDVKPDSSISMPTCTSSPTIVHLRAPSDDKQPLAEQKTQLEEFWKLETLGMREPVQENEDDKALQKFNETIHFEVGRYQVTLPWKEESPSLPTNYELAMGRLRSQVNRLSRNDKHLQKYDAIIQDQVQKGIVEVVPDEDCTTTLRHYIPHHEVLTPEKTTTKLRIVFDASAKTRKKNQSLNERLHRGPVILEDLCGLLLRFRLHKVALVPDVEKAFLQVGLQPDDRDVTRFLWSKDPSKPTLEKNVQVLRFTRVPFGMISSPFLLAAAIKHHLTKAATPIAHQIADNMYVDNMITGVETSRQADELYKEAKTFFQSASMNLHEWASNSSEFLQNIPECDRSSAETTKVLGTSWNLTADTLFINGSYNLSSEATTKKDALQSVSRIYDPLDLFSPATLNATMFIQEL